MTLHNGLTKFQSNLIEGLNNYYHAMCSPRKYPYSPTDLRFFVLHPLPPGNSSLASYFA